MSIITAFSKSDRLIAECRKSVSADGRRRRSTGKARPVPSKNTDGPTIPVSASFVGAFSRSGSERGDLLSLVTAWRWVAPQRRRLSTPVGSKGPASSLPCAAASRARQRSRSPPSPRRACDPTPKRHSSSPPAWLSARPPTDVPSARSTRSPSPSHPPTFLYSSSLPTSSPTFTPFLSNRLLRRYPSPLLLSTQRSLRLLPSLPCIHTLAHSPSPPSCCRLALQFIFPLARATRSLWLRWAQARRRLHLDAEQRGDVVLG